MTDPTPQPTPADDLVNQVELKILYACLAGLAPGHDGSYIKEARAVVALVMEADAQVAEYVQNAPCQKCGHPRNNHPYRHIFVSSSSADVPAADINAALEAEVTRLRGLIGRVRRDANEWRMAREISNGELEKRKAEAMWRTIYNASTPSTVRQIAPKEKPHDQA